MAIGNTYKLLGASNALEASEAEELFSLSRWYKCTLICHACGADKNSFMASPANLHLKPRIKTLQEFQQLSVKPGQRCLLV